MQANDALVAGTVGAALCREGPSEAICMVLPQTTRVWAPGSLVPTGVAFFVSQETSSRGRAINQHGCPHGQEEAQPGLWGLQLLVAVGWLIDPGRGRAVGFRVCV